MDIFKVIYKSHKDYFFKYIHQFSANILVSSIERERPSDYTDLEVALHSTYLNNKQTKFKHALTDKRYADLLLNGYLISFNQNNNHHIDLVNVLYNIINEKDYIGPLYELIIYIENKYWC